jgi:ABC-type multidrug transport system permease subunit
MVDDENLWPIKLFTYVFFIGFGFFCLAIPLTADREKVDVHIFFTFCYILSFMHLLIGTGILGRKKWGFSCLKSYLNFLKFGYPIGSSIANAMIKYIKEHNIELYFDK